MMRRDIYGGVTAVRAMGDDARAVAEYARAARVGEVPGPDIYFAALFAGPDFLHDPRLLASSQGFEPGTAPWMQAIDDQTDLATAVTLAKGTSAVAIKIYANLSAKLVTKIAAEAHRQGMQVWAHAMVFPATPQEVIDARPDTVSHTGYLAYQAVEKRPQRYQEREVFPLDPAPFENGKNKVMAVLFDTMRERGIILDATNYVFETIERMRAQTPEDAPPPPYCSSKLAELLCAQAYKHGVLISAGTDSFAPADDPYPALHSEIEILVRKCGMTPMDAIRSATMISAMSAGQQKEMGTLEPGKLANIIFLASDPLEDIAAIRSVELTVKRGVRFPAKIIARSRAKKWPTGFRCPDVAIFHSRHFLPRQSDHQTSLRSWCGRMPLTPDHRGLPRIIQTGAAWGRVGGTLPHRVSWFMHANFDYDSSTSRKSRSASHSRTSGTAH